MATIATQQEIEIFENSKQLQGKVSITNSIIAISILLFLGQFANQLPLNEILTALNGFSILINNT